MRKKQIVLYFGIFIAAVATLLGIGFAIRKAIRAGNMLDVDWYDVNGKEFVISTEKELYEFAQLSDYYDFAGQTIKLGADIVVNEGNAQDWLTKAPEKKWQPITEFAGTFDGQGYSISGLYGTSSYMSMGLFTQTKEGCIIQNFKLLNSYFSNSTNNGLGSIVGEGTGEIKKVYSDAIVYGQGESNGGIAGLIKHELLIQECWFDGQVIGEQRSNGGMVGWVDRKADVKIDNCLNSGLIKFIGEGNSKTGGFVGGISDIAYRTDVSFVTISNSLTTGKIEVTNTSMAAVAVGTVRQIGALTFDNTYAVVEVTDNAVTETTVGTVNGKLTGNVVPRYRETLLGVGGYQWTNLDFETYWSCVEDDTPILKCFADKELSLAGVEKEVDTSWYAEGETEFVLEDLADFWGFAMLSATTNFEGVTIKLAADITLNEGDSATWKEKGAKYNWFPIYSFSGTFDGQGHTISGLYVNSNGKRMALFQQVNANGSIANFKLVNSYVRGTYCIGAVVAQGGGNISNIYSDAIVANTGDHTAGILGAMNQNGTISNCWFDGEVHGGTSYTGGITSATMSTMCVVTHCLNTGTVYGGTKHSTGGLVGIVNNTLTLSDSLNAGKVDDSLSSNKNRTGSVIGRIFTSTDTSTITVNISSTYATRESYETSIGEGYPTSGAPAVNSLAELTGNEGYRRTNLNFNKFWAIDKDSHPTLQTFADEIPDLPENVKRPIVADTSWFDYDLKEFVINTPEELYGFAQLAGKNDFEGMTVKLGKNIVLNSGNAASWGTNTPLNQWASIHEFNGTFDGQGHTISGLFVNDGLWKVGLFGNVPENAVIKNVKVTNSYFEGRYHVGSIVGMLNKATMQAVYSDATVVARKGHGGGIVGTVSESTVDNAWFNGNVSGEVNYIGGITSFISSTSEEDNSGSTLSNCLNTGTVTGVSNVGGLVGRVAMKTTIKYSLGAGTVKGTKNYGSIVGVVVKDDVSSCNITEGVYATKESSEKAIGNGVAKGSTIVNTTADLTGVGGYQRTILDFNKYWSIVSTSTPVLKKFGGTPVAVPNVARATKPDTSWYNASKNTFVLTDYADLYGLAVLAGSTDFAGKTITLGGNIVANSGNAEDFKTNVPLNQLVPVSGFAGTFDGKGYTISGLASNSENAWYIGIIGTTKDGAVVKNVNVENSYLTGEYHIGSLVGQGIGVKIENVYSNAILEATKGHLGGIVGSLANTSSVSNCWFSGSVIAENSSYVGGITSFVGDDSNVTISHCLNTVPIKAKSNAAGLVGRVAGELNLTDSVTTGLINCMSAAGSVIGLITEDGNVSFNATYGMYGTGARVVGRGTNFSGDAQIINELYMAGISGYTYTGLDYNKYWTALAGKTPELSYFSDKITGEKVSVSGADRKDTSWYHPDKKLYVLNDRADLFGFTYLLNGGNTFKGKTVMLGKDIQVNEGLATEWASGNEPKYVWMPIGSYEEHTSYTKTFQGTFDGKMHAITGLYTKNTGAANKMYNWCAGLFARTGEGTVVKNVKVLNSYFESPYYNGVVGHATGTTIDTVYTDAIINSTSGNSGGIVGSATESNINNVWFAGSLENAGQFTGGIVGVSNNKVTISNALATGTLESTTTSNNVYIGGILGGANGTTLVTDSISVPKSITATKKNCIGSVIGGVNKDTKATATNTYVLASASNLTIGVQVKSEEIGAAVNRITVCSDLTGLNGYSLTKLDFAKYWVALAGENPELMSFSSGMALAVDTAFRASTDWYTEAEADGMGNEPGTKQNPYLILSKVDLYGFAELVNSGATFAGQYVELGADIIVNTTKASTWANETPNYVWQPIGSYVNHTDYSKSFEGNFDGKGYSISGLYTKKTGAGNNMNNWCAGLFGRTNGATVKNVKVLNSYFESAYYNGVIGDAKGTAIENVYTDAIVNAISGNSGGIVGRLDGGTVESAWFAGTITSKGQFVGGIVGLAAGDASINNILTTGTVKSTYTSTNAYAGGLVGGATGNMSLTNSLSAAKEVSATGKRTGAAFGSANAGTVTVTMDEVYVIAGIHKFATGESATGTYTEHPWVMPTLDGYNGYTLTKLDFNNTWVALNGTTPELKVFSEGTALNVADTFRPDTTWAGTGTETDPYVIATPAELYGLAQMVNNGTTFKGQYIVLGADITVNKGNAADWATTAPKQAWNPIGYYNVRTKLAQHFKGTFDGKMHTISGLYMDATKDDVNIGGLFVDTDACTIKNLKLVNSYISASEGTAAIAGWNNGGTFDTIYTNAIVKSHKNNVAGLVALINEENSKITNCWFDGELTGKKYVGGIAAYATGGKNLEISHCLNTGTVTSTHVADKDGNRTYAGGLVGDANTTVTITDCLVACNDAIKTTESMSYFGSVAGRVGTGSTVTNVYALSSVSTKTGNDGNLAGVIKTNDAKGELGYFNTGLDFYNYWVVKTDTVPLLKSFTTSDGQMDVTSWYEGVEGSETNPYVIDTAIELYDFAKRVNAGNDFAGKYIVLGADIEVNKGDASTWGTNPPTISWTPMGSNAKPFKGHFGTNGEIREIKGLYTNQTGTDFVGFFGAVTDGSIKNIKVTNSYFSGNRWVGGVAGYIVRTTVDTAYSDAQVVGAGTITGGIVGNMCSGTVNNCWFAGTAKGTGDTQYTGGIVGKISDVNGNTISNCLTTGTVISGKKTGNAYAGGILGGTTKRATTITNCLSAAQSVSANGTSACLGSVVGGVDQTTLTVTNVYALKGICNDVAIGSGAAGTVVNGTVTVSENIKGEDAALYTALDFKDSWVMMKDSIPLLKSFVDENDANIVKVDDWYTKAEADEDGHEPGSKENPYVIDSELELMDLATQVNAGNAFEGKYIILGRDLEFNTSDASTWGTTAPAIKFIPIGKDGTLPFRGFFNTLGEIREISGVYVNTGSSNFAGLFGYVTNGAVQNIKLTNSYVQGNQHTGSVVGLINNSTVDTVYSNAYTVGTVASGSANVGGVVGYMIKGAVRNVWFDGSVKGTGATQYVGGVVGRTTDSNGAVIDNCLATGTVESGRTTGNAYVGGILGGATRNTTVSNCFSALKSPITVKGATGCIGSVVGGSGTSGYTLTVTNCYAASGIAAKANGTGGAGTMKGTSTVLTAYTGADGYSNTKLAFDRPETTDVVEGYWVARKDASPALGSFVPTEDVYDITGLFVADTTWSTSPVKENIDGVDTNTYTITRPEELAGLASLVNAGTKVFKDEVIYLENDIIFNTGNAADWASKAPKYSWTAIGTTSNMFQGTFSTKGEICEISGLYSVKSQSSKTAWYNGLFGYTEGAVVSNIKVTNSYLAGENYVGVVGFANNTKIDTVYTDAIVNITANGGSAGGGIVGYMSGGGLINNCWFDGAIDSKGRYLGGILGIEAGATSITNCLVTGSIKTTCTSGNIYTGGLLGLARTAVSIEDCLVVAKSMQTSKTGCYGSVIGSINDLDKTANPYVVTVESVYALDNIGNTTVTVGRTSYKGGSISGAPVEKTVQELQTGYATLLNADYWMLDTAKSNTPLLKSFEQ